MFNKLKKNKAESLNNETSTEQVIVDSKPRAPVKVNKILDSSQKPSIISEDAKFEGEFSFKGSLHLDGYFKGKVKAEKIVVGKNGSFDGELNATDVVVFGKITGQIQCVDLTLNTGSSIDGFINYTSIKIQPGSSVSGQLNCLNNIKSTADH